MRMMMTGLLIALLVPAGAAAQGDTAARAFDHYEAIRTALARDTMENVATNARALAPLAATLAGKDAEAAANRVRAAKDLAEARDQFGNLSLVLVPKFMDAKLPGVVGFMCTMKPNAVWAQKGDALQNPYFGKVMLTCGMPLEKERR
jgi:hypothetical protein